MPILNTMPTGKGKLPVASTHSAKQSSQGIAYTDDAKPRRRGQTQTWDQTVESFEGDEKEEGDLDQRQCCKPGA